MINTEKIFQALGNQTRLEIVSLILSRKEISCQGLLAKFPLAQPTMSHHFKELINTGILKVKKIGVENYYSVDKELLSGIGLNVNKLPKLTLTESRSIQKGGVKYGLE
ncbi:helix-turn-helix transcriptional regulator [Patescibacteria group bacterium]|nr:helix-turn-helix transcriptional regulator [Patescibacteria group bacterium]